MTREEKQVPILAVTAYGLLQKRYKDEQNEISLQTLEAMALPPANGWRIDLSKMVAYREVAADVEGQLTE